MVERMPASNEESKNRKTTRSRPLRKDSDKKLELAESIARNSQRVEKTYARMENSIVHFFHWISTIIDRFIFSSKGGKIAALILAMVLYFAVNSDVASNNIIATSSGTRFNNVPVQVIVNSDAYEVSGIPTTVSCTVLGEAADIQLIRTQNNYKVTADLTGLTEGTHSVNLSPVDFSNRLTVTVDPTNVIVEIKKKTTQRFRVTSQYINTNAMDNVYSLSANPQLDTTEVVVRASEDTIAKIGYLKALIDVTGVTQNFETTAKVVAYDQNGNMMDVDIFPSTVTASVEVTSPQKEVPIKIEPIGEIPDNNAIDRITLDHSTVTVYAPESVLNEIDSIVVEIDATKINKDSSWTYAISLPSGVNSLSVTKVNIDVKIAEAKTKVIGAVPVEYRNNTNNYHLEGISAEDTFQSITVIGTDANIADITANNIKVYVDMTGVEPGKDVVLPIIVVGENDLVKYTLTSGATTMTADVVE